MVLFGFIPFIRKLMRLLSSILKRPDKIQKETEDQGMETLESLKKERETLLKENQMLKTLVGIRAEIER